MFSGAFSSRAEALLTSVKILPVVFDVVQITLRETFQLKRFMHRDGPLWKRVYVGALTMAGEIASNRSADAAAFRLAIPSQLRPDPEIQGLRPNQELPRARSCSFCSTCECS